MTSIAEQVVAEALTWVGTPYRHQCHHKGLGSDCLGLVRGVYENVTGNATETPPPYAADWGISNNGEMMIDAAHRYLVADDWKKGDEFRPGQVLIFRWRRSSAATHAAIVVSPTQMLHSYNGLNTQVVTISDFWTKMIAGVFRFPEA